MEEVGLVLFWTILVAYSPDSVQTATHRGTSFTVPMLPGEEGPFPGELLISISRKQQDAGTIHHHAGTTSTPFNVSRQRGYRWTVTQENPLSRHARSTNSLSVTTGRFVAVMAVSSSLGPTDGYLAIAVNNWGKEYYVITHDEGRSQVAITASEAMTSVLVTLPPGCVLVMDEVEVMAPEYVNVTLDQFEVLLLQADTDLTGTYIQADKPVGVVSGNRFIGEKTHLVEVILPIKTWGRNFVSAPNFDSHWGPVDSYRIISSLSDTNILVGNRSYNIEVSGAWLDVNIGTLVKIESDKTVMVMKFSSSSNSGTPTCMAVLVPEEQWLRLYTFITPLNFNKHWVTIVTHEDQEQSITLDSNPIQVQWSSVPGTNISVGVREVSEGTHYLEGSDNYAVYLSGAGNGSASYCYPAGMGVDTINTNWTYLAPKVNEVPCRLDSSHYLQEPTSSTMLPANPTMGPGLLTIQPSFSSEIEMYAPSTSQMSSSQDLSLLIPPTASHKTTDLEISSFDSAIVEESQSVQHSSFLIEDYVSIISLKPNLTQDQLKVMIDHIRFNLLLNQKNLSTYKRKHYSAPDPRVSARALGTFGVLIIISAVCILIAIDLPVLCHDVINLTPSKRPRMDKTIR